MTFSQNFAKMERLIGKEQADRILEVLKTIGIEPIDNQPSTLQEEVFHQTFFDEEYHYFPVMDDEELSKRNSYLLSVTLPGDVELKIDFCDFEFEIVTEFNGVSYYWKKDDIDKTLSRRPAGEVVEINSGYDRFFISYAISKEKDSFFVQSFCNTIYHIDLDCTAKSITNKVDNTQKTIGELDSMLDDFLSPAKDQVWDEELLYDNVKKPYELMKKTILNTANYIRQTNGLPAIEWNEKEKEQVLTKKQTNSD